ncbi:MAG TPA: class I SAM-dependent methyltransferase [Aestuariivirga sp.]|nr:class I SAM-dependent methyltransferase [Aestuariivirga sp.]
MLSYDQVVTEYGEWTAMSIKLPNGKYTRKQAVDWRLRRLLQVAADTIGRPLSKCRVLDLACLEGHYAIEFGLHGAETVGIEGREASLAKCEFVQKELGLNRAKFILGDVRDLSVKRHGQFDIIICSGILYHLRAEEAWRLLKNMHDVCKGIVLVDTFIALESHVSVKAGQHERGGLFYHEHDDAASKEIKASALWASLDNESSFWFTQPSLLNMIAEIGFTSCMEVLLPVMPGNFNDRRTYLLTRGKMQQILSSEMTNAVNFQSVPEREERKFDPIQIKRSWLYKNAKRCLPQTIKNQLKPVLRALGVVPPDDTPEFARKKKLE